MIRILHTEASPGWGGQELRILKEAMGMRERGYELFFALQENSPLVKEAREAGFCVYEIPFQKKTILQAVYMLYRLLKKHEITVINTHSSLDAWIGGVVARIYGCKVIRTRHLSTPIKEGWNSRILYNWLADRVITTCQEVVPKICNQARLPLDRCLSIPTGVDPTRIVCPPNEVQNFRKQWGIAPDEIVAGTLCVLRGWKGVSDLMQAAFLLKDVKKLKWMVVGGGVSEKEMHREWKELGLEDKVIFTGHIAPPYIPLAAMDIFLLLSWANEGVSQASLQAAFLGKPLVTTRIGGLPEVCIEGKTGYQVDPRAPHQVARSVKKLMRSPNKRAKMGEKARLLVEQQFTLAKTLDAMEDVYRQLV